MDYYSALSDWANLRKTAQETLLLDPTDTDAQRSLTVAQAGVDRLRLAEEKARQDPSVDDFLALSVQYYRNRRFEDSIAACNKALEMRPAIAEAYSNIAAAYYALGKVDESMAALKECLRIRPDFELAKKNLAFLLVLKGRDSKVAQATR
jgi:tetratricopeptide (TPR) repeat protein